LSDGRSLSVPTRSGFFLFLLPDRVLAHSVPRALVADDAQGRLVARAEIPSFTSPLDGFGGITRPPGGADLARKREVIARPTAVGRASVWTAPDFVSPAHCSWLQIGRAVYGGGCRRDQPPRRGLAEFVPLLLRIEGDTLPLLWGHVGADVARLSITFQDGTQTNLSHRDGVFLYPVPSSRWSKDHRPAFLAARDKHDRIIDKHLLYEYTLAR
jgi:hypothetical protein